MKFCIEVGEEKKHQIEYEFNQLLGRLVIKSNQQEVKRRRPFLGCKCRVFLNERLFRCYEGI